MDEALLHFLLNNEMLKVAHTTCKWNWIEFDSALIFFVESECKFFQQLVTASFLSLGTQSLSRRRQRSDLFGLRVSSSTLVDLLVLRIVFDEFRLFIFNSCALCC